MCKCNPSIRTPYCGKGSCTHENTLWNKDGCPPKLVKHKITINKAIEQDDLLFVDDTLVRPSLLEGNKLEYMNMSTLEYELCNLEEVEIKSYE